MGAGEAALRYRMTEDAITQSLAVDPEPVFRNEIRCQSVQAVAAAISPQVWESLPTPTPHAGPTCVFTLDLAPDHSTASIAVAWQRPDCTAQVVLAHF